MVDLTQDALAAGIKKAEPQKARKFAAGLTFNLADEAEAKLRSLLSGRDYEEVLSEIKAAVDAYEKQNPVEALGYEMGGAVAPAVASVLAAPFTGGTSTAATATSLGPLATKVAMMLGIKNPKTFLGGLGLAGAQGTLSGYGEGEGGVLSEDRLKKAMTGGVMGTAFGAGVEAAAALGKPLTVGFLDTVRRRFGPKVGGKVEAEIQQLVKDTGMTEGEVVQEILDGRLLTDNKTIAESVKAYRAGSPAASAIAQTALEGHSKRTQAQMISDMEKYLGGIDQPTIPSVKNVNILDQITKEITEAKKIASELYNRPEAQELVDADTLDYIKRLYKAAPEAFKEINQTRSADLDVVRPTFKLDENGAVVGPNALTISEAENIRSALSNAIDTFQNKRGYSTTANAYKTLEKNLRSRIDNQNDFTRQARQKWSQLSDKEKNFRLGEKLWKADPDPDLIGMEFSKLLAAGDDEQIKAFRLGVLTKLRAQGRKSPTMLGKKIGDENSSMFLAFKEVFPDQDFDKVIQSMKNSQGAKEAANLVLQGSTQTAITSELAKRQGYDFNLMDFGLDMFSIMRLGQKVLEKTRPGLTDREKARIVEVLTSQDPERIKRVLRDQSGFAQFVRLLDTIYEGGRSGVRRAGTQYIGSNPEESLKNTFGEIGTIR